MDDLVARLAHQPVHRGVPVDVVALGTSAERPQHVHRRASWPGATRHRGPSSDPPPAGAASRVRRRAGRRTGSSRPPSRPRPPPPAAGDRPAPRRPRADVRRGPRGPAARPRRGRLRGTPSRRRHPPREPRPPPAGRGAAPRPRLPRRSRSRRSPLRGEPTSRSSAVSSRGPCSRSRASCDSQSRPSHPIRSRSTSQQNPPRWPDGASGAMDRCVQPRVKAVCNGHSAGQSGDRTDGVDSPGPRYAPQTSARGPSTGEPDRA